MHAIYYKKITPKKLEEYAVPSGFGKKYPLDLKKLEEFIKRPRVLEVGCGTGRLGIYLIKKFDYTGIDEEQKYLNHFRKKLKKKKINFRGKILQKSFFDLKAAGFNTILFPWTVIGDFSSKDKQIKALKKARKLLVDNGVVILDNPAKGTLYNIVRRYVPNKFYYNDWKSRFKKLGFSGHKVVYYKTLTGRKREIIILRK